MTDDDNHILDALDYTIECAPDGEVCFKHYGTHNPHPGCTFVTARRWAVDDDGGDE